MRSCLPSASYTQHMWELLAGNRTAVLPRYARGRWITSYQYIEARAHVQQPTAWPLSHTCPQPYHVGSGSHGPPFRPYWGSSARHSSRSESELYTTHVGALGSEPYLSSPTTCAGKADHGFGVCVPLALICLLKIVK